jgi:hypothetical protein
MDTVKKNRFYRLSLVVAEWLAALFPTRKFSDSNLDTETGYSGGESSIPSRQMPGQYNASFHILSNSLFISYPIIRWYIVWANDSVVKWTTNK